MPCLLQIVFGRQKFIHLGRVGHLDLDHPAGVVRVVVDQAGLVGQLVIDGGDLAADAASRDRWWPSPIRSRRTRLLACTFVADLGQRDEGDVRQLIGGELRDADGDGVALRLCHSCVSR